MSQKLSKPFDLSDQYWMGLSAEHQALYHLIRPMPKAAYEVDVGLWHLEDWLTEQDKVITRVKGTFELDPDFQRGHVWTLEQRVAYMEALIRGCAPRTILFNCPGYNGLGYAQRDIPANTFQCIDGLQRLTSVRMFLRGDFSVFGELTANNLRNTPFDPRRYRLKVAVYEFGTREELLSFYLAFNGGGTDHGADELNRVRGLLADARQRQNK